MSVWLEMSNDEFERSINEESWRDYRAQRTRLKGRLMTHGEFLAHMSFPAKLEYLNEEDLRPRSDPL